jgi:hypothetical protein
VLENQPLLARRAGGKALGSFGVDRGFRGIAAACRLRGRGRGGKRAGARVSARNTLLQVENPRESWLKVERKVGADRKKHRKSAELPIN